jgi:hypothetical protein|tara:strand:- start:114 stop:326 length:213 start_codon:yes stop_codon:yes gene_type:complete
LLSLLFDHLIRNGIVCILGFIGKMAAKQASRKKVLYTIQASNRYSKKNGTKIKLLSPVPYTHLIANCERK